MNNLQLPPTISVALVLYSSSLTKTKSKPIPESSTPQGLGQIPSAFTSLKPGLPLKPLSDLDDALKSSKLFQFLAMS